ncbi:hypothetical protein ACFLQI_00260 [Candidatus Undinarchaeota archaeon]
MTKFIIAREAHRSKGPWERHRFVCYRDGGKVGYILVFVSKKRPVTSYLKLKNYKSALVKEVTIKNNQRGNGLASVILAAIMEYFENQSKGKKYTYHVKSWIPFTKDAWCWRKNYFPKFQSIIIGSKEQKSMKNRIEKKYRSRNTFVFDVN